MKKKRKMISASDYPEATATLGLAFFTFFALYLFAGFMGFASEEHSFTIAIVSVSMLIAGFAAVCKVLVRTSPHVARHTIGRVSIMSLVAATLLLLAASLITFLVHPSLFGTLTGNAELAATFIAVLTALCVLEYGYRSIGMILGTVSV